MDLNDIERIDEAEFRNKRTHSMPRPSTRQESDEGCSAATSRKHVTGISKEISYADLSSPNNSRRSYKSTSFVEKGGILNFCLSARA